MKGLWASGIVTLTLAFASCVTFKASDEKPISLEELAADPAMCTEMRLRSDVPIKTEIIHEASIMGNRFMVVLRYREGGDEKQFTPNLMPGYSNISLVSEVEENGDSPLFVYRRYAAIEMWRFYPEKKAKVCYLWTIGDDSMSMKVMLEDFSGEFLGERQVFIDSRDTEMLKTFYKQLMNTILKIIKEPVPGM
jgi:hypothetical protein